MVQQFDCSAMEPWFVNTQELTEEQEAVFDWQSHCLFVCDECVGWWVCDHHWDQLWGDIEDYNQACIYMLIIHHAFC